MLPIARALNLPTRRRAAPALTPRPATADRPPQRRGGAGAPVPPLSDGELVRSARGGDEAALDVLFQRHRASAVAVARRQLRDRADAEDAASEAFTRAFEHLPGLRAPDRFRPFLLAIVRSVASDRRRGATRLQPASDLDLRPAAGDVEADVVSGEASRTLVAAVNDLPARQRYAVRRFYWDDVPVAALAAELGVSVNATTQLLFRARAGLARRTGEVCRRSGGRR